MRTGPSTAVRRGGWGATTARTPGRTAREGSKRSARPCRYWRARRLRRISSLRRSLGAGRSGGANRAKTFASSRSPKGSDDRVRSTTAATHLTGIVQIGPAMVASGSRSGSLVWAWSKVLAGEPAVTQLQRGAGDGAARHVEPPPASEPSADRSVRGVVVDGEQSVGDYRVDDTPDPQQQDPGRPADGHEHEADDEAGEQHDGGPGDEAAVATDRRPSGRRTPRSAGDHAGQTNGARSGRRVTR